MFDIIQSVILSDLMILFVFGMMLFAVTSWAFRLGEYPGYILGWLIGIFFIVIYTSLTGDDGQATLEMTDTTEVTLTAFGVLVPAFFGLVFGFGLLFAIRTWGSVSARQGVLIAALTATLVSVIFFLAVSGDYSRRVVGIFALAFSIGALSTYVLKVGTSQRSFTASASAARPPMRSTQDIPEAQIDNSPYQSRLDSIRRFFNGER
ncbi:MAG: hypothetical protein RLP44_20085 [Aggregatilineales bacterium]